MRRRFLFAAAAMPLAAAVLVHGCGSDEPPIESICRWVADPDNCFREFHEDTVVDGVPQCATAGTPKLPDATSINGTANGTFLSREALDVCFIAQGGQVVFDPPIDLTKIGAFVDPLVPPTPQKMIIKKADGNECGSAAFTDRYSFEFTVKAPTPPVVTLPVVDAGLAECDAGIDLVTEGCKVRYPFGTYKQAGVFGRSTFDTTCPSGETHHFLLLEADNFGKSACPGLAAYVPQAFFIVNPGGVNLEGSVSFAISWPPLAGKYPETGAEPGKAQIVDGSGNPIPPDFVTYFNCTLPPAPEICVNGAKDGVETDIDCGGVEVKAGCPARCGDGQGCVGDCDCADPFTCQVVMGVKMCAAPATTVVKDCSSVFACQNKVKGGDEGDVDCGGSCPSKCADGKTCNVDADCVNTFCNAGVCDVATCTDKVKNGGEGGVDCGGPCPTKCGNGTTCAVNEDCENLGCVMGVCVTPTCTDMAQDGVESDVDCGGAACPKCADGLKCGAASDCVNGVCGPGAGGANVCAPATCGNTMLNAPETDVDCGGGSCPKCVDGLKCVAGTDCVSGICTGNVCVSGACSDMMEAAPETDIDCGGGSCPKCADGKKCKVAADCVNGVCGTGTGGALLCFPATCANLAKDGSESDIDCGGPACPKCSAGKACLSTNDCASNLCIGSLCQ